MDFWIVLQNAQGKKSKVRPGENYDEEWTPTGEIENYNGVTLDQETREAQELLADIEGELVTEGRGAGDWVKYFAKPVAEILGKQDCISCEVRGVILNAAKLVIAKHGKIKGSLIVGKLLRRSFTNPEETVLAEFRELLGKDD